MRIGYELRERFWACSAICDVFILVLYYSSLCLCVHTYIVATILYYAYSQHHLIASFPEKYGSVLFYIYDLIF